VTTSLFCFISQYTISLYYWHVRCDESFSVTLFLNIGNRTRKQTLSDLRHGDMTTFGIAYAGATVAADATLAGMLLYLLHRARAQALERYSEDSESIRTRIEHVVRQLVRAELLLPGRRV
jgi:hypothetical protein